MYYGFVVIEETAPRTARVLWGTGMIKTRVSYGKSLMVAAAVLAVAACNQPQVSQSDSSGTAAVPGAQKVAAETRQVPAGGHPLGAAPADDEYGEFLARPEELANVPANQIIQSIRLNAGALVLGRAVYVKNCASCHGEDLKGIKAAHAPDLTDDDWRFSGDNLPTGGAIKLPSDIEWTVRYGVRSGNPNARGVEADMLAFDPQYRNQHDLEDYGRIKTVTPEEIDDLAEYVLQLTGQPHDAQKSMRGGQLFLDNAKGNCFDCHQEDATGNPALGSTNLTRKDLFLYGSDKASIVESITKGRRGVMPQFGDKLKPEELHAVAVYVFSQAAPQVPLEPAKQ
jgi:cytochrome c oxidase cbb3-type subunit 3